MQAVNKQVPRQAIRHVIQFAIYNVIYPNEITDPSFLLGMVYNIYNFHDSL